MKKIQRLLVAKKLSFQDSDNINKLIYLLKNAKNRNNLIKWNNNR